MPSVVNHVTATTTSGSSLTTPTFNASPGNTLVIGVATKLNIGLSLATSGGDAINNIDNGSTTPFGNAYRCSYAFNIVGGANYSVTVTPGSGVPPLSIVVVEINGVTTSNPFDQTAATANTPATTAPTSGTSGTTIQSSEIAVTFIASDSILGTATLTPPAGYTLSDSQLSGSIEPAIAMAYKVLTSTGTQVAVWTTDSTTSTVDLGTFLGVLVGARVFRPKVLGQALNRGTF